MNDELRGNSAIVVSGEATLRRAPDLAVVTAAVSVRAATLDEARVRANGRASEILAMLRGLQVAEGDVSAPSLQVHPTYDHARGRMRLSGYEAVRPLSVRVRDLAALGPILDGLADDGSTQVHGTSMELEDPTGASREALAVAVADARGRAEAVARAANVSLGAPLRIEEEGGGMPAPYAMRAMKAEMAGDTAATEIAAGEVEVSARVRAWYALEQQQPLPPD
jgi:uncharacterized protein YggE